MSNLLWETIEKGGAGSGLMYAACSTASNVQIKTIEIEGVEELFAGLAVNVKFINANSFGTFDGNHAVGTPPMLNINDLGAKAIKVGGENAGIGFVRAGDVHTLVYDGTAFNDVTADVVYRNATEIKFRNGSYMNWNGTNLNIVY